MLLGSLAALGTGAAVMHTGVVQDAMDDVGRQASDAVDGTLERLAPSPFTVEAATCSADEAVLVVRAARDVDVSAWAFLAGAEDVDLSAVEPVRDPDGSLAEGRAGDGDVVRLRFDLGGHGPTVREDVELRGVGPDDGAAWRLGVRAGWCEAWSVP